MVALFESLHALWEVPASSTVRIDYDSDKVQQNQYQRVQWGRHFHGVFCMSSSCSWDDSVVLSVASSRPWRFKMGEQLEHMHALYRQETGFCCRPGVDKLCGACRRISVQQTRQHAHVKHVEFVRLRETLKQLSPASDTSCADVATISPRAHARSGGSGGGLNDSTQTLLDLGQGFHAAQKRLEASVDSALKVTQEAPRLREDLLRLFNALGRVGSNEVVSKGRSIAWAMAAITGEFGCNVSQNVGTLQFAVETLKSLLSSDGAAKGKGTKRKADA